MNCTKEGCQGRLRITHTYTAETSKYQRAVCDKCRRVHNLHTIAQPVTGRGEGAKASAGRAKKNKS